jgi:hypothetical protein
MMNVFAFSLFKKGGAKPGVLFCKKAAEALPAGSRA